MPELVYVQRLVVQYRVRHVSSSPGWHFSQAKLPAAPFKVGLKQSLRKAERDSRPLKAVT
jgi:hypothetical protein